MHTTMPCLVQSLVRPLRDGLVSSGWEPPMLDQLILDQISCNEQSKEKKINKMSNLKIND